MSFPFQFPHAFGDQYLGNGLPITGWWPDINVAFTLSVPPSLSSSALPVVSAGLSVPPALAFAGAGRSTAGFALSVPPALADTAAEVATAAAGLSSPPSLAFTGAPIPLYDHSAKSAAQSSLASGSPFTWSSGAGTAGSYGLVILSSTSSASNFVPGTATASVTWGGTALTSLGWVFLNNTVTSGWVWVFKLPSILAGGAGIPGGAQTISATLTQSGKILTGWGTSISYQNCSGIGSLVTAFGSSTSPSVTVTPASASDIVLGGLYTFNQAISLFSLPNLRQSAGGNGIFDVGDEQGSSPVTISGTVTSVPWAAFGLDVQ